jgi:transposase InsO family protein
MPWGERILMDLRAEFVSAYLEGVNSMSALCREYGISRKTGYKWVERYRTGQSLCDQSRRPKHSPCKTPAETEKLIIRTRQEHPAWGAAKLLKVLQNQGIHDLPSTSTVGNILRRNHLISPRVSAIHRPYKRFERAHPNELWQMDFKGDFLMENHQRCYPLTVLDDCSRCSLGVHALPNQRWAEVRSVLVSLFETYGLPDTFLSDNGPPWGNGQSRGMTEFEVWMMQLDILPIHGRALHPQTQGKEERFHRTMKEELLSVTTIKDLADAQRQFDAFVTMYNTVRPHHALKLDVPCKHYTVSKRRLPNTLSDPMYDDKFVVCRVRMNGSTRYNGKEYYVGSPLADHTIAVEELPDDCLRFCFYNFEIAKFDLIDNCFISRKIFRL